MPLDFVVLCLPWEGMFHPTTEQMGKALQAQAFILSHLGLGDFPTAGSTTGVETSLDGGGLCSTVNFGKKHTGSKGNHAPLLPQDGCRCQEEAENYMSTDVSQQGLRAAGLCFSVACTIHPSTRQSVTFAPRPHSQIW